MMQAWKVTLKNVMKRSRRVKKTFEFLRSLWRGFFAWASGKVGALEFLRSSVSWYRDSPRVWGKPTHITIEPTNICNLRCPVCETGAGILDRSPRHMTQEEFEIILNKIASHAHSLFFYFMGEPFLNPQFDTMIAYAKGKGVTRVTACTNGEMIDAERIIGSGIDEVAFQVGGVTQGAHQAYRVGGNIERVWENLQKTIRCRNTMGSRTRITCGFILMKTNEEEMDLFRGKMRELGVDEYSFLSPCVRTFEQGKQFLPVQKNYWLYSEKSFSNGLIEPLRNVVNDCPWIFHSMVVQVNGNVVPCCRDVSGKKVMGNLLCQDLGEIWNSLPYQRFRRDILQRQNSVSLCALCTGYGAPDYQ
jgi:radical SAM protein with 4Fe4S-binding SPASM domain